MSETFKITAPDGKSYRITAPDGTTQAQAVAYLKKQLSAGAIEPMKAEAEKPSPLESAWRGAAQGLTLNFGDEIAGAAKATLPSFLTGRTEPTWSEAYAAGRDETRKANKAAHEANPGSYLAGEIGGSIPTMFIPGLGVGKGLKAASTLPTLVKEGAKLGAKVGAIGGLGASEGGALDHLQGTLAGAAGGAALGGALPPLFQVGAALSRPVTDVARRAWTTPTDQAAQILADRFSKYYGKVPTAADIVSKHTILPDSMLADVGGRNTHGVMRSWLNRPNAGRDAFQAMLDARQAIERAKIGKMVGNTVGDPKAFYQTTDKLVADRAKVAGPLYKQARQGSFEPGPLLQEMFTPINEAGDVARPTLNAVKKAVEKDLRDRGIADPVAWTAQNPIRALQLVKFKIDKLIKPAQIAASRGDATSAEKYSAQGLLALKKDLMQGIAQSQGSAPGLFKQANDAYSGGSALKGALESGRETALQQRVQPEEIAADLAKLTPAERELYAQGWGRGQMDKIAPGDELNSRVKGYLTTQPFREQMQMLAKDQPSHDVFWDQVKALQDQVATRAKAQGNSTTGEQLAEAEAANKPSELALQAAKSFMSGKMGDLGNTLWSGANYFGANSAPVAEAGLNILSQHPLGNWGAAAPGWPSTLHPAVAKAFEDAAIAQARLKALTAGATTAGADALPANGLAPSGGLSGSTAIDYDARLRAGGY